MSFRILALLLLVGLGCASPKIIPGVVQPRPGETLSSIPGPMPGLGPFKTPADAIQAACPVILNKPHATAGRPTDENFNLYWQMSQEYCAWVYYTPDHQYEISWLAAGKAQNDNHKRTCDLPSVVDDSRYAAASLGYLIVLHNHPYENVLSDGDIRFIIDMAVEHGLTVQTHSGVLPISIIAFYSNSETEQGPGCDGFFQYIPATGELLKWTHDRGRWGQNTLGRVVWTTGTTYRIDRP